jgi:altronate dehydratase large subunit
MSDSAVRIRGWLRPDGRFGIRNHLLVIPTSVCSSVEAVRIAEAVPRAIALPHQHGCCQLGADFDQTSRTLAGLGANPNVGAVLIVSLGCEGIQADTIAEIVRRAGKMVEVITIQQSGGSSRTVQIGREKLRALAEATDRLPKSEAGLDALILGMECGGSDATSGLAANPVVGLVSDMLVAAGGTSILSETTELIGAEHILSKRCRTEATRRRLLEVVADTERRALAQGSDMRGTQPTPGNIRGGITTLEEKSLGCVLKGGTAPVESVLAYAEPPASKGLHFMDTPGQDIESITGMVAGGAQIILFTTGRGTATGCPVAPVIKLTANALTFRNMGDSIDADTSGVIDGSLSMEHAANALFAKLVTVALGELTKAELTGHNEFAIYRVGATF